MNIFHVSHYLTEIVFSVLNIHSKHYNSKLGLNYFNKFCLQSQYCCQTPLDLKQASCLINSSLNKPFYIYIPHALAEQYIPLPRPNVLSKLQRSQWNKMRYI